MLKLYNSLSRQLEEFKPIEDGKVSMYNCGPTVYDFAHIGNFRAYLFADILRRYLEYKGFVVNQVMNITDVGHMTDDEQDNSGEDKVEKKAKEQKKTPKEIADFYTKAFFEDSDALGLLKASKYPKATEHVNEMIDIITKLKENGFAYESNKSIYFDLSKFPEYGKLSGNTLENLQAGARIAPHPDKNNPHDFALWIQNPNHVLQWDAPWGKGYPGWHIECSAMGIKYLGETFDIHTGGEDNKFPHHECEIAQSTGATGKKFVNYWLHVKHLLVENEKMSKSKGNFYTIRDLIGKGYSPNAIRLELISAQYRQQQNFSLEGMDNAQKNIDKLNEFVLRFVEANKEGSGEVKELIEKAKGEFEKEMDNDLNTPGAIASLFDFMREINKLMDNGKFSKKNAVEVKEFLSKINSVLNIISFQLEEVKLTDEQKKLIDEREKLRAAKEYEKSDKIREQLLEQGIQLKDTPDGVRVKKV